MPEWVLILAAHLVLLLILVVYLLGVLSMLATLLAYLQARGLRPGPVVAAAIGFIAGVAVILLAVLAGGVR